MKILISETELQKLKSRDPVPFECEICGSVFHKPKHYALRGIKGTRNYSSCSKECWKKVIGKRNFGGFINLECEWCKKKFQRTNKDYKRINVKLNKKCFCSRKCCASWQAYNGMGRNLRSSLEVWIESQLMEKYPHIPILYNNRKIIGKELDIYVPSLKLAIELNGAYHYYPIYGKFALQERKKGDMNKVEMCKRKEIDLLVIDCKEFHTLKQGIHQNYISLIFDAINLKIGAGCK